MADGYTANLNLTKPEVGGSRDTWGTKINQGLDALDSIFTAAGTGTSVGLNVGSGKTLAVAGTLNVTGTATLPAGATVGGVAPATVSGTQTLTNKTLTSPTINTASISGGTINNASIGGTTPGPGAFTTLSASSGFTGAWAYLPSGTKMLFVQSSAPVGWTKDTTHDNKALRIVSGTAGSGGSVAFTAAFSSKTPAGTLSSTALSVTVPRTGWGTQSGVLGSGTFAVTAGQIIVGSGLGESAETLESLRGSANDVTANIAAHTHTFTGTAIDLAVQYVDAIIATKD